MKSVKFLLLLLVVVFVLPFVVFAEEEVTETIDEVDTRVAVYFFHGSTCPHCADARTWFESIQDEYGDKFKLVEYEVWNDEDNAALMQKVSDLRNDNATGVPYIICGDKSWIGFSEEEMASEITSKIDEMYATDVSERYDVMNYIDGDVPAEKENKSKDVISLIIILLVVGGVGFGIYKARKSTN